MSRGRVVIEEFTSAALAGNPLGDPHVRRVPVYLPPSYDRDGARRFPVILVLTGFGGRGRMLLNDDPWSPSLDDRMDALIAAGHASEAILVMADCFTRLGGSQYMDSTATGRYETHLIEELVPWIDARYRTLAAPGHRGVMGKSSGGYGALRLGMRHPDVFGAVASHSGDMYFEYCYRGDVPGACSVVTAAGGVRGFLERFESSPRKGKDDFLAFNVLGMAACYSPDPAGEMGFALPWDPQTGAFRDDVWQRWLAHDPLQMLESHAGALAGMRLIHLDCGSRDEYHLHLGARLLSRALSARGIGHIHEEFDDGHRQVGYRYDVSLPAMTKALAR